MKMKRIVLSVALLTVAGNIVAMGGGDASIAIGGQGNQIPQNVLPSKALQDEASAIYKTVTNLKVGKDGSSLQLPADFIELLQNTFTVAHTMTSEEGNKIEQLQMAYAQITCPYWRQDLTKLMGNNRDFMKALTQYDADQNTYNIAWETLRRDAQQEGAANANPTEELQKLITLDKSIKKQVANLQTLFKSANKDLETHMAKIDYLVKQNIQWIIAFGMAINPDFKKSVTEEMTGHLTTALKNLHTSPKVAALQKKQATTKK